MYLTVGGVGDRKHYCLLASVLLCQHVRTYVRSSTYTPSLASSFTTAACLILSSRVRFNYFYVHRRFRLRARLASAIALMHACMSMSMS